MAAIIRSDRAEYLYSGKGVQGTATANTHPAETAWIDARGSDGFLVWRSGSSDGPTAGGSATFTLLHSHDKINITPIDKFTAIWGTGATAAYSAGPYAYIGIRLDQVYSAAQTGTGFAFIWISPSPR